ncbi:unnamed protein product [Spirodela intermedia]|uniref:Uncharacterized protein n=1 Tax=Spirodela intermedia TaxID=51605 RepID=A0A7I8IBY8_SPIIN|nr:unnamed protein product [Spirodela intermedia]CAA6655276.1 unnamed protein product [Spirodela intermedia]
MEINPIFTSILLPRSHSLNYPDKF